MEKHASNFGPPGSGACLFDLLCKETPHWGCRSEKYLSGPQQRLDKLLNQSGNTTCADCGSPDPKWVSLNLGAFICIKCSGAHRSLGVHISKVLSVKLDQWTDEQVNSLVDLGGNTMVNLKYEACLPDNLRKPGPDSFAEERSDYIRRKYELQQFLNRGDELSCHSQGGHNKCAHMMQSFSLNMTPSPYHSPLQDNKTLFEKQVTKHRIGGAFRNSWVRKDFDHKSNKKKSPPAGMVEFVGLIKVNVVRGTNLAVRDMLTSDPYVIISLGHQSVKTRVIKNNLNPVWNECLMLSIPDDIPPLKVVVYDRDTFKADDFMGEAGIDIQPLLSTARANENQEIANTMLLGKRVESNESAIVKDSVINLVDGKVKQQITLRLQKVETGELEIELECVPLS